VQFAVPRTVKDKLQLRLSRIFSYQPVLWALFAFKGK